MNVEDQIYLALAYKATNIGYLARKMGMTRQNLCKKINRNTLTKEDLAKIAKILGAKYISYFLFPNGVSFGDNLPNRKH